VLVFGCCVRCFVILAILTLLVILSTSLIRPVIHATSLTLFVILVFLTLLVILVIFDSLLGIWFALRVPVGLHEEFA